MPFRHSRIGRWTAVVVLPLVLSVSIVTIPGPAAVAAPETTSQAAKARYTSSGSARSVPLARLAGSSTPKSAVWVSTGRKAVGKWVRWTAPKPTKVSRVRIAAATRSHRMTAGVLRFSDGSRVRVRADAAGRVDARFSARTVRWVQLTISTVPAKHTQVALTRFLVGKAPAAARSSAASAVASVAGRKASALTDARRSLTRGTGRAWTASAGGTQRVTLRWAHPARIDAVQVYGSPVASGAAPSGTISFSGGGSVSMLPVAGGRAGPTTVAFPARTVRSLTITLTPRGQERLQLREVAAFAPGSLPPASTAKGGQSVRTTAKAAASCSGASAAAARALRLVCPSTGTAVRGATVVAVAAPASSAVTATAVLASGRTAVVATATAVRGTARLAVDTTKLPGGPIVLRVSATGVKRPLYVQLVNRSRAVRKAASSQPAKGRTLVFDDEFSAPLSVSGNGAGSKYAATKPASWGNSEFGDAVFSDPAKDPQNISVVDGQYLRIRTTPLAAGEKDPNGWGRRSRGGIVSSASVPGGGFGAQYGYFEARMLAPASPGTWPAFWMMSSDFLKNSQSGANSEVDAVELYGQDASYSCHSWHDWKGVAGRKAGKVDCVHALPDWAMTWHTYGVAISKTGVKYYIDGRLVSTGARMANANDPFYFMLDLSLGGGWPIDLTGVNGIADLYVDYVRVYV